MNVGETLIEEIGNKFELNEKSADEGIWKGVERKRERGANGIVKKMKKEMQTMNVVETIIN